MTSPYAPRRLTIAGRASVLAGAQLDRARTRLAGLYPHTQVGVLRVEPSRGARGGTRPGVRDRLGRCAPTDAALRDGRADLAVRSLKDVPAEMPADVVIAAVGARDDPRDALVSTRCARLDDLPDGGVVGTSSLRRGAQLRERRPAIVVEAVRGGIGGKLDALDAGRCDAIVVAVAGLKPLGLADRIADLLDPDVSLPAVGQGAIAYQCRADRPDLVELVAPLADAATTLATAAERACLRAFAGAGLAALAAHAQWSGATLWLRGLVASADGREILRAEVDGEVGDLESADALGSALADALVAKGAARLACS